MKNQRARVKLCEATGKIGFESEATASRRANAYEQVKRYYYCKECGMYHLTSWHKVDYNKRKKLKTWNGLKKNK